MKVKIRLPPPPKFRWGAGALRISPVHRFLLVFGVTTLVGFAVEVIPWVDDHVIKPYIDGVVWLASGLIILAGGLAVVNNAIIHNPVNGFSIMVANGCTGLEAVILLAAGMMAFPATWRQRLLGWAAGTVAILTLNLARIISLYYLGQYSQTWFDWAHYYAWDALIILDALVVFFLWVKWLPPYRRPRHASSAK